MKFSVAFFMTLIFFLNSSLATSGLAIKEDMQKKFEVQPTFFEPNYKSTLSTTNENCEFKNIPLYGKVKFVESFPTDCGKWQIVESFPDFTVQVVTSFPDLKVKTVDSFPGIY